MLNNLLELTRNLAREHIFLCYVVVFLMSYLESFAFVGLIMPGAGFAFSVGILAYHHVFNIYYLMVAGCIGAILADISSFFLARYVRDRDFFSWIEKKYGIYIKKGEDFFQRFGPVSIFLGRFIGFTRPVVPFVAGLLNMKKGLFLIYSSLSGILWAISYYGAGYLFGVGLAKWNITGIKLAVLVAIFLVIWYFWKKNKG